MNSVFYIDGQYVQAKGELLQAFTPGLSPLHGAFTTAKVVKGKMVFGQLHVQRLLKGLNLLRIKHAYTSQQMLQIARRILSKNPDMLTARLRIMVWREKKDIHAVVTVQPYKSYSQAYYRRGMQVCVMPTPRKANSRQAHIKSLDYGLFAHSYQKAQAQGFDEAILLNEKGQVFEASRANIFAVIDGVWVTPPLSSGCLAGITRQLVMDQAQASGLKVREQILGVKDLIAAQKVFLTNSLIGLMPVGTIKN